MSVWEDFDQKVSDYLPDLKIVKEEPMSRHTTFHVGGPAKRMAFPVNPEQLVLLLNFAKAENLKTLVVGNGSNLLVADEGLDRLVIDTSAGMNGLTCGANPDSLVADAGVTLARLADFACRQGLAGLEFSHGIPGTVGGGVWMNAGAYGGEIKQVLRSVRVLFPDEGIRTLTVDELNLSYRHSIFMEHREAVILSAEFQLKQGKPEIIRETMHDLMNRRKASQPLEYPSAGSTFKRPSGHFAGTLIDQCGLKGMTVGGAQVSEKHAGFVINCGQATFADVMEVIEKVQKRVLDETGVQLEPEVQIVR